MDGNIEMFVVAVSPSDDGWTDAIDRKSACVLCGVGKKTTHTITHTEYNRRPGASSSSNARVQIRTHQPELSGRFHFRIIDYAAVLAPAQVAFVHLGSARVYATIARMP